MKLELLDTYHIRVRLSASIIVLAPVAITIFLCFQEIATIASSSILIAVLLSLTNWQNRLKKRQTRKFVSQFLDTHREVAHLVLMTVYLQQESERRQQN